MRKPHIKKSSLIINLFLFMTSVIFLFPVINADVVSVNAGGTGNIIVSPDKFIEGFFSCVPDTCSSLGYECGSWDDSCGRTLSCGSCASGYTCSSGTCVSVPSGDDGGGAAGGAAGAAPACNIVVDPSVININLKINTNVEKTVKVINNGATKIDITPVNQHKGINMIFEPESFSLGPGQTKELKITFVASDETGTFTNVIQIGCATSLSSSNVETFFLLFDSNIVVLNPNYQVPQGDELKTEVTLIPLGDEERLDVTLNYGIRDYNGNVYLTKSETLLIDDRMDFKRNFDTGSLPLGKYIVGLELIYPNGVAPSSAHFEVIEKKPADIFATFVLILIILILIIAIIILVILIIRAVKKRQAQV